MAKAITVSGLVKRYGELEAVSGLDLEVHTGEIVAVLGPNGAGKTTTIEILEGYRQRDSGDVEVLGVDPALAPLSWRDRIGIVLQESEPVPELTSAEALRMQSHYYRSPHDPEDLLRLVGLWDARDQRTRKLSGGQRRRLDLALALVGDPELIFLDEPTTGFDPSARRESWEMIDALRSTGRTVVLTTHYMDEAQHLADRIVVIGGGSIVAEGTVSELAALVDVRSVIRWDHGPGSSQSPPEHLPIELVGGVLRLPTDDVVADLHRLTSWAIDAGADLPGLTVERPSLEDTYLSLLGEDDR